MQQFELNDKEYIELNKLLKYMRLVESGGEANAVIVAGEVKVNQEVELRKRKKLRAGDVIQFMNYQVMVQ